MRRAEKGGRRCYRGKKPRRGLSPEQAGVVFLAALVAIMALTIHANSQWSGMSAGEQLYQAVFVAKDWD